MQLLDCIKNIKKIPDTTINNNIERFINIISDYKLKDIKHLIRLVQKYPPSTRALLGAILDELNLEKYTEILFKTLNPITKYNIGVNNYTLTKSPKWNLL